MMDWIVGGLVAVGGVLGLVLTGRAVDPVMYWTGLGFFVCSVLFCFGLIRRNFETDD